MALLLMLAFIFPEKGILLWEGFALRFFKPADILPLRTEPQAALDILNTETDTATLRDPVVVSENGRGWSVAQPGRLQYPEDNPSALEPFFVLLERLASPTKSRGDTVFHILHYGDSQIEGDRISGYLRHRLQGLFGGSGPGLFPAVQTVPARNVRQTASENWQRYLLYGPPEFRAPDRRYGLMMARARYEGDTAGIYLSRSATGYAGVRQARTLTLLYEGPDSSTTLELTDGTETNIYSLETRRPRELQLLRVPVRYGMEGLTLRFRGPSPEIFGIVLDGSPGIQVDNIPMRGASGTFFRSADSLLFARQAEALNVRLVVMEFGGNMLPHIHSAEEADRYGVIMEKQFRFVRRAIPRASLIVIGPADMAVMHEGRLQTHPWLEALRDALRRAAFRAGAAFWDMYAAMGGRQSILAWVEARPPLASPDFIHFTPSGAEKIAGMFTAALVEDFNLWRASKTP